MIIEFVRIERGDKEGGGGALLLTLCEVLSYWARELGVTFVGCLVFLLVIVIKYQGVYEALLFFHGRVVFS